jgi:internalin A
MRRLLFLLSVLLIISMNLPVTEVNAGRLDIPDPNLEAALRDALNKPVGEISDTDLEFVIRLNAGGREIVDITGLQHCDNLVYLDLSDNRIVDISVLSGLYSRENGTKLRELNLNNNEISDISPLADLWQLESINLADNLISDLLPLGNENQRFSVSLLNLSGNRISDIAHLRYLTGLQSLYISGNDISEVTPLLENRGLGIGDIVNLHNNPLSEVARNNDIPALKERWVKVFWSLPLPPSPEPVTLVKKPEIAVSYACPNLEALIREVTGKPFGTIYRSDLDVITALNGRGREISDVTGIEYCINLHNLYLGNNDLVDITPLAGLSSLATLGLENNRLTDISGLGDLRDLSRLYLDGNRISDIGPLQYLEKLTVLRLGNNLITDLSPLVRNNGLDEGSYLSLGGNSIGAGEAGEYIETLELRGITVVYWEGSAGADAETESTPRGDYIAGGLAVLIAIGVVTGYIYCRRRR